MRLRLSPLPKMAAEGSGWITTVVCKGRMTLAFALLVFLLAGLPQEGDSTIPVVKPKSPTAEECRQHVDKAVDQYFGTKSRDQTTSQDGTSVHIQTPPTDTSNDDENHKNPPIATPDKNQTGDDDDDDDDDDDETIDENVDKHKNGSKDNEDEDDEEDDEEEDEGDEGQIKQNRSDDDKELLKQRTEDEDKKDSNKIIDDSNDDDDDDDDDDDEDEDDDTGIDQTVKIDANLVDDDDDEDDEDDDEINDNNGDLNDDAADDDDDDNERDSDTVTKDNITKISEHHTIDNTSHHHRDVRSTKIEPDDDENDDEEDDDDEEDTEKEEDEDDDDDVKESDGDDDDDDDENGDDEDEEEEKKPRTNIPRIQIIKRAIPSEQKQTTGQKATGGPDLATARVAQELPRAQSPTDQPKAQEVPKEAQTVIKPSVEGTNQTPLANKTITATTENEDDDDDDDDEDDDDDDLIENIYEDDDDDDDDDNSAGVSFRSRVHVDAILNLDSIGTGYDQEEDRLALPVYRDIKKIHAASIKPMEVLYKYTDSTSRLLGDAEIFNKPMILFLGPWSTGKTAIINYLLGIERSPEALKIGTGITDVDFTVITHGDKRQTISGTELAVDWKYASLQRFGQGFLDHFKAVTVPHTLLKKINIVDTPGILENRKNLERGYPFNDAFQWFIDRADAIYVVLEPTKIDVGAELGTVVDQLKGREVRFILNKADTIRRSDLMKVVGQLFWNLSPLMGSSEAPVIYAVSLSTKPFNPTAPAKFLADQENNFLFDLKDTMDKRVENRILYARRHAVRVRNHAKMVDCYLATYYRHKSIFSNKKNVAKQIIENPKDYQIYEGLGNLSNVSRYDIPDTSTYTNFFRLHSLYDFRPLASTCSYFRGCPMDKLDMAISVELPELLARYKKFKNISPSQVKQEGR